MNPQLSLSDSDVFVHLGYLLPEDKEAIQTIFGTCKCLLMAGSSSRAKSIAKSFVIPSNNKNDAGVDTDGNPKNWS